jgi:hypothetical protein
MAASDTPHAYSGLLNENINRIFMVQVAAPASLPEGFQFDATFEGKVFTVTVVC